MTQSVLIHGQDPDTVDFTIPALPSGMAAAKANAGLTVARKRLEDLGYAVELCLTDRGEQAAEIAFNTCPDDRARRRRGGGRSRLTGVQPGGVAVGDGRGRVGR